MSEKTDWQGLWKQRDAIYASATIKKSDIPKYAKLIVRYNKYYEKDSNRPKFVFCFANGDSYKAITMEVDSETFQTMEEMTHEIEMLKEQIEGMYTYDDVQRAINGATRDALSGYTDNIVSDYI